MTGDSVILNMYVYVCECMWEKVVYPIQGIAWALCWLLLKSKVDIHTLSISQLLVVVFPHLGDLGGKSCLSKIKACRLKSKIHLSIMNQINTSTSGDVHLLQICLDILSIAIQTFVNS